MFLYVCRRTCLSGGNATISNIETEALEKRFGEEQCGRFHLRHVFRSFPVCFKTFIYLYLKPQSAYPDLFLSSSYMEIKVNSIKRLL